MYFKDLYVEEKKIRDRYLYVIKIAWLDTVAPFTNGDCPDGFLEKLKSLDTSVHTKGFHSCPFCKNATSNREYYFKIEDNKYYNAPHMIIHYIEEHNYLPPSEFIDYVMNI